MSWPQQVGCLCVRGAFRHAISQRKFERLAKIHTKIVVVYGNVMNRHVFLHLKKHLAWKKLDNDDEVQEEVMT
jgi:DMSO reductase anchor subunit